MQPITYSHISTIFSLSSASQGNFKLVINLNTFDA